MANEKKIKIELNKTEVAQILWCLISTRHSYEEALRKGKLENYKLTTESRKNMKVDIENYRKLENFFDEVKSKL